jgi:hypothetical protein
LPAVISGDTYCERTKFIRATADQLKALNADEALWRPLVQQVADQNDTYILNCVIPDLIKETK